jgi:hypothetical protein
MGRKIKRGLDYYPVDVDIASDIKMRKLLKRCGGQAYTVYAFLLCLIYKNGYYIELDEDLPFILSEQTGYSEEYIGQVIDCCLDIDLFNKTLYASDKVITSRAIQERYSLIRRLTNVKNPIDEFSLISCQETPISCQEMTVSSKEMPISCQETPSQSAFLPIYSENSAQRKENKSKVKENNIPQDAHTRGGGEVKNLYFELGKWAQIREDVWDAVAISGSFQNDFTQYYREWLQLDEGTKRLRYPLNQLNQSLRKQAGEVNTEWYHAICWCKDNLSDIDYREIYGIAGSKPQALTELRFAIKEIGKGKITQPGTFILSRLRKL